MDWSTLAQSLILMFAGAWLYSRGSAHGSILPLTEAGRRVASFVKPRPSEPASNGKPQFPRVTS